jgi:putative oxidoreductase
MICVEQQLVKLNSDIGKLILRVSLASLMLFHGYAKITGGIEGIKAMITSAGLPSFLAYGVYLGEFVFPLFIIAGLFTRTASLIFAFTMGVAIFLPVLLIGTYHLYLYSIAGWNSFLIL